MKDDPLREVRELTAHLAETRKRVVMTRDFLIGMGKEMWGFSYQHVKDDHEAFQLMSSACVQIAREFPGTPDAVKALTFLYLPLEQLVYYATAKWADLAFPVVQVGHKYAAALMATYIPPETTADIQPPFDSFLIEIPPELLSLHDPNGSKYAIPRLLVHRTKNLKGEFRWNYVLLADGPLTLWKHGVKIGDLSEVSEEFRQESVDWDSYSFNLPTDDRDEKLHILAGRLILNVCLAMSDRSSVKAIGRGHNSSYSQLRDSKEPLARVFQVGKPIPLDCRQALREFLEGSGKGRQSSKLHVQFLVRGHWKRQPFGQRSEKRKWIWVQPYWKGPEEAAILSRPHQIKD